VFLDKIAWNEYVRNLGKWADAKKPAYLFDVRDSKFVFEQVFRPDDHDLVADLLQKWIGVRIWNENARMGRGADDMSKLSTNVYSNWTAITNQIASGYKNLAAKYEKLGKTFPVPDWKERLYKGHQIKQLNDIYPNIAKGTEPFHEPYRAPAPDFDDPEDEKQQTVEGPKRSPQKRGKKPGKKPDKKPDKPKPRPARPVPQPGAVAAAGGQAAGGQAAGAAGRQAGGAAGGQAGGEPDHIELGELDLHELYEEHEQEIEEYYSRVLLPVRPHNNKLRAEIVQQNNYEALNGVHLLQTDNDVQPVMGAVHIVKPAEDFSDKHFMFDVEGDINEGQKVLVERSKRGPFRDQSGRSTVMDRSAHVTYRKRAGAFEITVRRGVIASEMRQLLSKLSMHRMSVHGSHIVIIKGNKRFRLGPLDEINFKYLSELIDECIQQYGSCGLEITETQAGRGALYKAHAHGARFKSKARKRRGVATM